MSVFPRTRPSGVRRRSQQCLTPAAKLPGLVSATPQNWGVQSKIAGVVTVQTKGQPRAVTTEIASNPIEASDA